MEKKKKKTKYQPLDISMTVVQSSWADDESATFGGISEMNAIREKLPSAPKAVRTAYDITQLPAQGPWKAHVSNLPFNVKDDDLMKFLGGESEIEDLNIPTQGGRMRGFAVVTFVSREALANAMEKSDDMLMNRRITISLSNDSENRGGRYGDSSWGGRRDDNRRAPRDDDDSDWRSMAVQSREDTISRPERPGPSNGDWNRGPPRRTWQDDDPRSGPRSSRFGERSDRGDRYDDRERDREGPPPRRERDWERGSDRAESAWNRDRDTGDRDRERDRGDRETRDRGDRDRDRDYGRDRRPAYDRQSEGGPRERPKLVLQPRSKPAADTATAANGETARPASIFGAAKPVDTASREREIESRIDRERREAGETPARRRGGLDREEMPPPTPPAAGSEKGTYGRARKSSDSSTGKNRNPSLGSGSGGGGLPLRQSSSDISPASPPPRGSRDGPPDGRRPRMTQASSGPGDEDDVFSQTDSRQRRSSTTSSNTQHDGHHQSATQSQPVQSTLVDAPPPSVNVWQVRRDQMQRRVAEAVADSQVAPRSAASTAVAPPATNSAASAATPHAATPIASAASHPPTPAASSAPTAPAEEKRPVAELAETQPEASSERTAAPTAADVKEEKEEKAAPAPQTHSQPRRSPVVVSVVAAQRAAAEGQPPPPPIRENAWQQSHAAMDAVRRPPSPSRMPQNTPPQSYASDRSYSYSQGHSGHGNDWSDGGPRGMSRGDYRDNSGGYRGGYRGGRGGGSWRGGGGRGNRGGSGYRSRGRGGGGGYRGYSNNSGEAANTADM